MLTFGNLGKRGRLGNALYQFAATYALACRLGERPLFNADWIHRPCFSVPDEYFGDVTGDGSMGERYAATLPAAAPTTQWRRDYLQDYALFAGELPAIRRMLAPSPGATAVLEKVHAFHMLPRPILSVHVRRGDNVIDPGVPDKRNYWPLPSLRYYTHAVATARHQHHVASVAVFSDDIGWCQEHVPADYYHHGVSRPKEHERDYLTAPVLDHLDLQLMARADHHVVSNSTFGWWAALLAGDEDVIYPWPIVGPKLTSTVDMTLALPSKWHLMAAGGPRC